MSAVVRPRCEVFIATSLDGFVARANGSIDWLEAAQRALPAGEDCGYAAFVAGIDALVMGRASFEQVLRFDPWPYGALPVTVASRRGVAVPPALADTVRVSGLAPAAMVVELAALGRRRLYVDGGLLVQAFLAEDLVDAMTVTTVPVLLGKGRPLFGPLPGDRWWRRAATRSWDFGFVQTTWERMR